MNPHRKAGRHLIGCLPAIERSWIAGNRSELAAYSTDS
ncbi:hypothetical protein SAMN05216201_105241 [Pseudomonas linyingensis]|uniref:Uncharacterized protein n=1 Tax=Pseudomonas linyingensis TaxID=915471 RepID=A0A1H6WSU7_9PSED|nr:hypothetical protein SAMN05216201_105241 [Pseudomonas linyingensis]